MYLLRNIFFVALILISPFVDHSEANTDSTSINDRITDEKITILDLKTAMRTALRDSQELKAAQAKIDMAEQKYKEVRASYLPEIDLIYSAKKYKLSETDYVKNKLQANLVGLKTSKTESYYNTGISAKWLLYNGFQRKYSLDAAEFTISINKYGRKNISRKLLFAVADTYFSAQLAKENITILKADGKFYHKLYEDARTRKQAGQGSLNDELSFEVKLNTARAELLSAEQEYTAILSRLAVLLGYKNGLLPAETMLAELQYEDGEKFRIDDVSGLIDYAVSNRPDVLQYKYFLEKSAAEIKIAKGRLHPRIWVEGIVNGSREKNTDFDDKDFGDSVAIKLSYNIFSGGADSAVIAKAKAGRIEKEHEYRKLKIQICSEVNNSYNKLKSSIETYKLYMQNALLSQKNRELVKIEYTAGKCSLVRLNEVQRDHSMIKSREALALVSVFQAKFQLEAYTGRILKLF